MVTHWFLLYDIKIIGNYEDILWLFIIVLYIVYKVWGDIFQLIQKECVWSMFWYSGFLQTIILCFYVGFFPKADRIDYDVFINKYILLYLFSVL